MLQDAGNEPMIRFHPVAIQQEVSVYVEVTRRESIDFGSHCLLDMVSVEVLGNEPELRVTEILGVLAFFTNVIHILSRPLIWAHHDVVAINRRRDTRPDAFALITAFDERLAPGKCIVHPATSALIKDGRPTAVPTSHGPIECILSHPIGETVPDQNRFKVDIQILVTEDFRREHRDVVACVRLSGNMKILVSVLRKLLEEQSEQRINIFACCNGIADGSSAV